MSFKVDYQRGVDKEMQLKPTLETYFEDTIKKTGKFDLLDYEGENCWIEIKSRRNTYQQYPTTLISKNKIDFARTCTKPVYFVFDFTDQTRYIKYDYTAFSKFECKMFKPPTRFDKVDVKQLYYFVPIQSLTLIG